MGVLDRFRSPQFPVIDMTVEQMAGMNIIEATDGYVIVADEVFGPGTTAPVKLSGTAALEARDFAELGSTRSTWSGILRDDYNPALRGHKGLEKYDEMRKSDSSVKGALRVAKTPILSARWFVEPFSDSPEDEKAAEFLRWNLFQGMSTSFYQLLWETLLMLDFGAYYFEKVYDIVEWQGEERVKWKKLAPRHPLDLYEWEFDHGGGPLGAWFYDSPTSAHGVYIPVKKLAIFTHERESGNLEGVSVLRPAYKNWYYKENLYKIDAIQKERHGIGIPIINLPPGFSPSDKQIAHEIGRNLRTNEKAHVVLPPMWQIAFAKLEGQHVDALESANHHARMIFQNILAEWIVSDSAGNQDASRGMFLKSSAYIAEIIRDVFNKYCIPQLMDKNWELNGYPELRVRRIGDIEDWRIITFAIRNLVGAGTLVPDDELEKWVRDEMDMPKADKSTARHIQPKQQAGLPRQSPANKQKLLPGQSAGKDSSGVSK
jgi:hypothetical protein